MASPFVELEVGERVVRVTNPDKVLFPDADEPILGKWWQSGSHEVLRGFIPFGLTELSPEGVKLEKAGGDADSYVRAVVSQRGRTGAVDFVGKWGVADPKAAATQVWELVSALGLVTPVRLVGGRDRPLPGSAGAHQVDASRVGLVRQSERYVCSVCGRVHARPTPGGACTKTYCAGTVERSDPPENDYNVSLLSRPFAMVTPEEHTAQVPPERRDAIEKAFKRPGGAVNTLVASPTLELGVDIGALDLVLCRNVPPTAANYWQRVGRAGRRRRMAVVYVYCRQAIHDAYFFEEPVRLLGAPIRPPRFNLKNDVLVRKHVHAAVLSELLRIARAKADAVKSDIKFTAAPPDEKFDAVIADASLVKTSQLKNFMRDAADFSRWQIAFLLPTAGSFGEIFSFLWETLFYSNMPEKGSEVERLIVDIPTVSKVEEISRNLGLSKIETVTKNEFFEFKNGAEFINSPLIADFLLPSWMEFLDETEIEQARERLAQIVDADDGSALTFRFSVKATLFVGEKD